ncbi:MAG: hypothetical protein LV480_03530 [Methylacidiphilales bacterium]|nr:hypothetical protein [Candidatus Methylacidiphilales bacterium]
MACYLSSMLLGLFAFTTWAGADPAGNPYTQTDADGVPLVQPPSQQEIEAARLQQQREAQNKDSLLRTYEQRLQARTATNSEGGQSADRYYQLSSNKGLAQLAGLPALDSVNQGTAAYFHTGASLSGDGSMKLRSDAASGSNGFESQGSLSKPMISPLLEPGAGSSYSSYLAAPISMTSPFSNFLPRMPSASRQNLSQGSSDLDTPGLIAAEKDPELGSNTTDLKLNILPGETVDQAREHQDNYGNLALPVPAGSAQLQKAETAPRTVPGPPKVATDTKTTQVKTAPAEDPNAPQPVSQVPVINPVRAPIANPYDILDH